MLLRGLYRLHLPRRDRNWANWLKRAVFNGFQAKIMGVHWSSGTNQQRYVILQFPKNSSSILVLAPKTKHYQISTEKNICQGKEHLFGPLALESRAKRSSLCNKTKPLSLWWRLLLWHCCATALIVVISQVPHGSEKRSWSRWKAIALGFDANVTRELLQQPTVVQLNQALLKQ